MSIYVGLGALLGIDESEARKLKIGVAVSGGRDSVALLHLLCEAGYDVVVVNVEHGIRGDESLSDSRFVKEMCKSMGIPFFMYRVDAPAFAKEHGYTLEQGARILRYNVFDGVLAEGKCDYIALAHHLDDQVATVLMRIMRGTGIRGLVGMKAVSGKYLRPLLKTSRTEIDDYIEQKGLSYVEDSTNMDTAYTRNFVRDELSVLKTRFPAIGEAIMRLSSSADEAENFIDSFVPKPILKDGESYIKTSDLANISIAKRLISKAAEALGVRQDIEERHYPIVLALANAENGKRVQLTHDLDVHKQGEYLVFTLRNYEEEAHEIPFREGVFEEFKVRVEAISADSVREILKQGDALYIDADGIPSQAVIRRRRNGDVIAKFGGGTKSLGDFLTDKKIPKRKRDSLAVIAVDNRVLAVAGVDISSDHKITENTKKAYRITLLK